MSRTGKPWDRKQPSSCSELRVWGGRVCIPWGQRISFPGRENVSEVSVVVTSIWILSKDTELYALNGWIGWDVNSAIKGFFFCFFFFKPEKGYKETESYPGEFGCSIDKVCLRALHCLKAWNVLSPSPFSFLILPIPVTGSAFPAHSEWVKAPFYKDHVLQRHWSQLPFCVILLMLIFLTKLWVSREQGLNLPVQCILGTGMKLSKIC